MRLGLTRKIQVILQQQGLCINHKRVQRLMKVMGIKAIYPGPRTSIPASSHEAHPYLLKDLTIDRPNQVWATDITYIRLPVGMVYMFALIDWFSRYIVGWMLSNTLEATYAIQTLEKALHYGTPAICNADQGSQFTGHAWIKALSDHNIRISHDGIGRCIDNVRIERFWRTLKYEDTYLQQYETMIEARQGIGEFIVHYNHHRPHQALDYACPHDWFTAIK